jgi:acyl-CoA synthetase (AMP-forming)/AMP-acid ligase II
VSIDNVTFTLINNAERRPNHTAVIHKGARLDYRSLELRLQRFAGALREQGIKQDQIVALSMEDSSDLIVVIFAIMRLGAILLPLDSRWKAAERNAVVAAFGAEVVITDKPIEPPPGARIVEVNATWRAAAESAPAVTSWGTNPKSPLLLSLSSGTTGVPKGPLVTHELYMARLFYESLAVCSTQDDINMCALPMYFGAGRNITLQHVMMGATVVMFPPPYEVEDLIKEIHAHGVTSVYLVPTILRRLLKLPNIKPPLFPSMRAFISGAAPLYEEEARRVRALLSPRLYISYGTTEAGVLCYLTPEDEVSKLGSVGRPCFLSDVRVVDDNHRELPRGQIGRVSFKTPAVPDGFYNNPAATEEHFHDGRFLPGDLGRFDEDGFLYLVGRSKEVIIRGGVNIYPNDVESSLLSHEAVVDAAVVGWPIGEMGEEIAAIVVTKEPVSEQALIDHCRSQIAPYKIPRRVFFMHKLPRNEGGKVSKKLLGSMLPKSLDSNLEANAIPPSYEGRDQP